MRGHGPGHTLCCLRPQALQASTCKGEAQVSELTFHGSLLQGRPWRVRLCQDVAVVSVLRITPRQHRERVETVLWQKRP